MKPNEYTKNINAKQHKRLGYFYFLDKEHPLATGDAGFVYLHRHIASVKIGRWVRSDEHVHHEDDDRTNNKSENLKVLSAKKHGHLHQGTKPVAICETCGKVL